MKIVTFLEKICRKLHKTFCFSPRIEKEQEVIWQGSSNYWQERYLQGGNSGAGSYNHLAQFKAEVINKFVKDNGITSVVEWGCGDGNQLLLADYPQYVGLDVSEKAIRICSAMFKDDESKKFVYCGDESFVFEEQAELALSLDVIYHLIEDDIFDTYMKRLFASSNKYVCIYSCNDNENNSAVHVKHRKFTDWIEKNMSNQWRLKNFVKNRYPYDPTEEGQGSWSDFYFYEILR